MSDKQDSIHIQCAWGDFNERLDDPEIHLKAIGHCICQLEYYLNNDMSANREFTASEIDAYKQILETGSDRVARDFLDLKHGDLINDTGLFNNNHDVIQYMRDNGKWI